MRIGCVSYLNAKPLIQEVEDCERLAVRYDVPARLLDDLESRQVDIALCPVIDFWRSDTPLVIVPVGGIGCDGPTLTVRLYSQVPIDQIDAVHVDTDSHTSVALLQILLRHQTGRVPMLVDYHARENVVDGKLAATPQSMLLIGDKVVTDSPQAVLYPFQLDLGQAWRDLTGLPFVFATWMARKGEDLGSLPQFLHRQREKNLKNLGRIVATHAAAHGWPEAMAMHYLGHTLQYEIGPRQLQAIERFGAEAAALGLINTPRRPDLLAI